MFESSVYCFPRKLVREVRNMRVGAKRDKDHKPSEGVGEPLTAYKGAERRVKPRIYAPFSALVRGVDARGIPFEIYTHLHNLSAEGVSFRTSQQVTEESRLFIVTRLSPDPADNRPAPRVAIRVVVLRVDPLPDGMSEVAARIVRNRFLWQQD